MLNMSEIPTEFMLTELAKRYENLVVSGCKGQSKDESTSLLFAHGHTVMNFGLTHLMLNFLTKESDESVGDAPPDIP